MSAHFQRAVVLLQQSRFEDAIGELHLHLGQHTGDAIAHGLLARCFLAVDKFDEATEHAQQAIASNPEEPCGHESLARVMLARNRYTEARQAIDEALRLNPYDPDLFGLLASWNLSKQRWSDALTATNQGLELDPEHNTCLNLRAQALVMLGDKPAAAATIEGALRRNPDDSLTHANQGWAMLHSNQPLKAAEHFRESLRLDPTNELARAGMVEALKARHWVYRGMLAFFLKAARWPAQWQWAFMVGGYLFSQQVASMTKRFPSWAGLLWALLGLYLVFALMTWLASPMFNLLLRVDRFGKHCLDDDDRSGANCLAATLGTALLCLVAALTLPSSYSPESFALMALFVALSSVPVSCIHRCQKGWPRLAMAAAAAYVLFAGICGSLPLVWLNEAARNPVGYLVLRFAFLIPWTYAFVGSQFLGAYLQQVEVKK